MLPAPPQIIWDNNVSEFLDGLVDLDIGYLDVQSAVERIIHAGLLDDVSTAVNIHQRTFYVHKVPVMFQNMQPVYVITMRQSNGAIRAVAACFAD